MADTFKSYSQFIEKFVLPLNAKNPSWKTLNGDAGSSQAIAAKFLHDGNVWKVHEDARFDSLLAPYQAMQGIADTGALIVTKTMLKTIKLKDGKSKVSGGNPKLVPKPGFGSAKHFFVYFDKKA
jgi:hypothetical protein